MFSGSLFSFTPYAASAFVGICTARCDSQMPVIPTNDTIPLDGASRNSSAFPVIIAATRLRMEHASGTPQAAPFIRLSFLAVEATQIRIAAQQLSDYFHFK